MLDYIHDGTGYLACVSRYPAGRDKWLIAFQGVAEVGSRRFRVGIGRCSW
jgi:hypothetical protein